jgi:hypothetical protein
MPTPTYTPLATVTLGTAASSVTFSSIPATYRDLILVITVKSVSGNGYPYLRLNADSGNNYNRVSVSGGSAGVRSALDAGLSFISLSYDAFAITSDGFDSTTQFLDYSATDKHKTTLTRANQAAGGTTTAEALANRWANTAAITSAQLLLSSGNFAAGSTFNLYGVIA